MVDLLGDGGVFGFETGSQDGDSSHGGSVSGLNDDSLGRSLDGVSGKERNISVGKIKEGEGKQRKLKFVGKSVSFPSTDILS